MIKLVTILKEMAISNAWSGEKGKLGEETDAVIEAAKKMGESNPVLWRGTRGVPVPGKKGYNVSLPIMRITPRDNLVFKGGTKNAIKVIQLLQKRKQKDNNLSDSDHKSFIPVFAHFDRSLASIFGEPCVLVLEQPYQMYQSSKIKDIMADTDNYTREEEDTYDEKGNKSGTLRSSKFVEKTEKDLQGAAASYEEITNKPKYGNNEIIVNVVNYWAIPCGSEIKTYGDLVDLLESYKTKFA